MQHMNELVQDITDTAKKLASLENIDNLNAYTALCESQKVLPDSRICLRVSYVNIGANSVSRTVYLTLDSLKMYSNFQKKPSFVVNLVDDNGVGDELKENVDVLNAIHFVLADVFEINSVALVIQVKVYNDDFCAVFTYDSQDVLKYEQGSNISEIKNSNDTQHNIQENTENVENSDLVQYDSNEPTNKGMIESLFESNSSTITLDSFISGFLLKED